jgi:hypothetical protein
MYIHTEDHKYYMPPDNMQLPRQPDAQDLYTGAVHHDGTGRFITMFHKTILQKLPKVLTLRAQA